MSKIIIVHRWDGTPDDDWYPWLKTSLENQGHQVTIPTMPHTSSPNLNEWVALLTHLVPKPTPDDFFIGHSIGCLTIMHYVQRLLKESQIGGALLIAPWTHLVNLETKASETIAKTWTNAPINWPHLRNILRPVTCLFSDDDPWVPVTEAKTFKTNLSGKVSILPNHGHFTKSQEPSILEELVALMK